MRFLKIPLAIAFLSLVSIVTAKAQNVLYGPFTFDDAMLDNWQVVGSVQFTADGTASLVDGSWGTRTRIESTSLGGAAVLFDGDLNSIRFRSPLSANLDFSGQPDVFLSFHQYYRRYTSTTELNVYEDGSLLTPTPIALNTTMVGNVETSEADTVIIDLSEIINQGSNIQIEFVMQDSSYFWLLDDVVFYDEYPNPATVPVNIGNYLFENGYPYEVEDYDNLNGDGATPYVPYELVVQYVEGTMPDEREDAREEYGAVLLDSCACGLVELWEIDGSAFFDPGAETSAGETIDILTNKDGAGEDPVIDTIDLNYYNGVILNPIPPDSIYPLTVDSLAGLEPASQDAYKIGIIDTGVDYQHPELKEFFKIKSTTDCYETDSIGWNFVDRHNNPFDDNGHGTHVAGIIADTLKGYNTNCEYEFIPYKSHDHNGVGTLFYVTCATYQAVEDDVDIINDSWGFFGNPSPVLRNAMDAASEAEVLIVTAAGNDTIWLDTLLQYPACYDYNTALDSVITVGATDSTMISPEGNVVPRRAAFSNYSRSYVDILAPGALIESTVPRWVGAPNNRLEKSGTSMSTPMVTAATAIAFCCNRQDDNTFNDAIWAARDTVLLSWAVEYPEVDTLAVNGRFLRYNPDEACLVPVDNIPEILADENGFLLYPNPARDQLWVRSKEERSAAQLMLVNAQGQYVRQWRSSYWFQNMEQGLDLAGLPAGIYYLRVIGTDYQWTGKVLKQ